IRQLPYLLPYSGYSPLGSQVRIDAVTGLISGKAPAIPGKYSVNVCVSEFRHDTLLNIHRKDFILKIGDCSFAAAELKPSYLTCDGFNLSFQNNNNSPEINSYYWEFGDPNSITDTSTQPTPTYNYPDSGTYFVKLVINRGEKCSDSTISKALVYPGFIPDFDINGSCSLNPYQFIDRTTTKYGIVDSWRWNFGDVATTADTSHLQNPLYQYPSPQSANVQLIVTNSKGCTDTLIKSVDIPDKPILTLPFRDTLICNIDSLQLQSYSDSGNTTATFSWLPALNIINANAANPVVFPKSTTIYSVTVNNKGCINTDSVTVNVIADVQVNIGNDTTICQTDSIQLHPVTNALYFNWAGTGTLSDSTVLDPFIQPLQPALYQLTASVGKCVATDEININVVPYPQANARADTSICFGKTTVLNASIVAQQFTWSPVSSLINENTLTPTAGPQSTTEYILSVTDVQGCPKPFKDTVVVNVVPRILAFAGRDTTIVASQALQLNATGGDLYSWSPSTGMDNPNIANPIVILSSEFDSITYKVKVSNIAGCAQYDDLKVTVFKTKPDIFIPTAFTPNADMRNDILTPKAVGIKQFNFFRVFNRWGLMLYSTTQQGQGWDGTYAGTPQASGTYVFVAQAIDYTGKLITKKGTVVLIR
ncbi:MAG: PKD domain-containing protein, partial [Panacibacter sp.]